MLLLVKNYDIFVRFSDSSSSREFTNNVLTNLDVAVTRARNILWFVDRDTKGDAVKEYFNELKVIKVCRPGDELPVIGATSSPEQWKAQGRAMYDRKNYRQVSIIFLFSLSEY